MGAPRAKKLDQVRKQTVPWIPQKETSPVTHWRHRTPINRRK